MRLSCFAITVFLNVAEKDPTARVLVTPIYSDGQALKNAGVPSVVFAAFCTRCRVLNLIKSTLSRFAIAPMFEVAQMQKDGGFASAWNEFTAEDRFGGNASVGFDRFDRI